jgi:ribosomal-protein-alanine N-acetyltransferase
MQHNRQLFLKTPQVDLVLIDEGDSEIITSWFNNPEVTDYLARGAHPMTLAYEREFLKNVYKGGDRFMLGIYHKGDNRLIGITGLHQLHELNQTAVYGVCIGEKEYWGKGIGTEVLTAVLEYAFKRRNLRNVTLCVLGNNPRGRRCYEKCGFVLVGTYPKHVFKNGMWHDEHLMIVRNPNQSS